MPQTGLTLYLVGLGLWLGSNRNADPPAKIQIKPDIDSEFWFNHYCLAAVGAPFACKLSSSARQSGSVQMVLFMLSAFTFKLRGIKRVLVRALWRPRPPSQ